MNDKAVCDEAIYGGYSRAVAYAYGKNTDKNYGDAVKVMRRALAESDGDVRIITVGSFANIASLLKSAGDEISPLTGRELVKSKVRDMYSMAGCFAKAARDTTPSGNVMLCLDDSRYVAENFPKPITYSPFELGVKIRTGEKLLSGADNPMKMAYYVHNAAPRESWDPVTAYAAIAGEELFIVRENVTVTVDGGGAHGLRAGRKGQDYNRLQR